MRALPRPVGLRLGAIGGRFAAGRRGASRAIVRANLAHVVPELDAGALEALVTEAFIEYGRYWAVTARLRPSDARRLDDEVVVEGREHVDLWKDSPIVFALPHLGAWEVGGFWSIQQGLDLTTVVEPARSARLEAFFTAARTAIGLHVLALGPRTATELLSVLDAGRSIALVADRDLLGDGLAVQLFSAPTRLPAGPALLALRSGAPIVPTGTYLEGDGRVRIVFRPPIVAVRAGRLRDDLAKVTGELATAFEGLIGRAPAQWHVFQPNWPAPGER